MENDYFLLLDNSFSTFSDKNVTFSLHIISPLSHEEIVRFQAKALFETVQSNGFSYVNAPISYAPGVSQRIQRPAETIRMKGGNCIDISVMFASLFEAIGFDVSVVLLPSMGHSMVAARTWADSDESVPLEATVAGSSTFEEAIKLGKRTLDHEKDAKWIRISDCRKQRIMPLT